MSRAILALGAAVALAACAAEPPNDVQPRGVGFGDYSTYSEERAANQARLQGRVPYETVPPPSRQAETVIPPARTASSAPAQSAPRGDITAIASAAITEAEGGGPAPAASPATQPEATAALPVNPTISDEQDFEAVAARETIESDAERLARMQEQRVVVAPTDLPERPSTTGPNIVEYALSTTHPVGEQRYRRSIFGAGRHEANCLSYRSDDLAQQAFLARGGPDRDPQALDPDGDGYACGWDPEVYRRAARTAASGG